MLKINGIQVKSPSELVVTHSDPSKIERTAAGTLVGDCLPRKHALYIKWNMLEAAQWSSILNAISDNLFFTVETADPRTGGSKTYTVHLTQIEENLFRAKNNVPELWRDCKLTVKER